MKQYVALLLALILTASPAAALAGRGGGHGGSMSGGHGFGGARSASFAAHSHFVRPLVHPGVNPVRPVFPPRTVIFVGGGFFLGWPYYYPPYYPPAYAEAPAYADPPAYVEQGDDVRYYCPDYGDYYPNVSTCPSQWLQVLPDAGGYSN